MDVSELTLRVKTDFPGKYMLCRVDDMFRFLEEYVLVDESDVVCTLYALTYECDSDVLPDIMNVFECKLAEGVITLFVDIVLLDCKTWPVDILLVDFVWL